MLRKLKIVSLSAIAVIMIVGCGKSSTSSDPIVQKLQELPKVSVETRTLAKSLRTDSLALDDLPSPSQQQGQPQSMSETKNCTNGGTMTFSTDVNASAIMQSQNDFNITMISEAVDCLQYGTTGNGKIQILTNFKNDVTTTTTTFLTDFNLSDATSQTIIKKDSFIIQTGDITTETMEVIIDGKTFKTIALKSHEAIAEDGKSIEYNLAGKETIDGKIFTVDETYDASQTPMVTDADGNLQKGGKSRYTNDQNHTIMIEVIDVNKVQISVDKDGDGKVDNQDMISI